MVITTVNPAYTPREISVQFGMTSPKVVVTTAALAGKVIEGLDKLKGEDESRNWIFLFFRVTLANISYRLLLKCF